MEKNEGTADRAVRIVLGIVLLYVGAVQMGLNGILSYVVVLVALILLVTGITGFCGLYSVFGIKTTCKIENKIE
ncbi:MAG: DUF2892 domain-containing protein [Methanosarcinales archaeon]|nr:DUF2892 domain-containing protein [Methanosarcinales archaeon]